MRSQGFTLLELMTVLAVMLGMSTLSIVSLGPMRSRMALRQGGERLEQIVALGRERARALGRCIQVELRTADDKPAVPGEVVSSPSVWLRPWTHTGCGSPAAETDLELGERFGLPGLLRIQAPEKSIVWRPTGRTALGASQLEISDPAGNSLALVVTAHGPICLRPGPAERCP